MKLLKTKKGIAFLAVLVIAAVAAFGAYAYFTTTGNGTGSASVGNSTGLTIVQKSSISNLLPGGASKPIEYTIANTLAGDQYVGPVTVSISSVVKALGAPAGTCDSSDFSLVQPTQTPGDIAGNATFDSTVAAPGASGASISMLNKNAPQNACQGATVNLAFSA